MWSCLVVQWVVPVVVRAAGVRSSPLNDWLVLGCVAFGVGTLCTLMLTRSLPRSAKVGLVTIPAALGSMTLLSRQRQRLLGQQTAGVKLQLQKLQAQEQALNQYLQQQEFAYRDLAYQTQQLQVQQAELQQGLKTYQLRQQEYQRAIYILEQRNRKQQQLAKSLGTDVQTRQQYVTTLEQEIRNQQTQFNHLELEFVQLQSQKDVQQTEWESARMSGAAELAELEARIRQNQETHRQGEEKITELEQQREALHTETVEKRVQLRELEQQVAQLQEQQTNLTNDLNHLNELVAQKQSLFQEVDLTVTNHQDICQKYELEIKCLESAITTLKQELQNHEQELADAQLRSTLSVFSQPPVAMLNPQPAPDWQANWREKFVDNPHLDILLHIEQHGVITEAEAGSLLGNPRFVRQFANRLSEYALFLPFSIRVEASATGSRYLKEPQHH